MAKLNQLLKERQRQGNPVRNAVIGTGMMGSGIVDVMTQMEGMSASFVADIEVDRAKQALLRAGVAEKNIVVTDDPVQADKAIKSGLHVASTNGLLAADLESLDVVTESTGIPEVGANVALRTITAGKHIVMMNVETDVCIGPLLKRMADSANVIYTGACGDEPACTMELIDFARSLGLEVVAAGKGKNTPWHPDANPETVFNYMPKLKGRPGINPRMISEFVDGSKTAIEMSAIANAAGLLPEVRGMHGPTATRDNLHKVFTHKDRGGILSGTNVIDYCIGVAPGVFCVVTGDYPTAIDTFGGMFGDDPVYALYRPYHLTSLETPLAAAKAVLLGEAAIAPQDKLFCEVICCTKKELVPGEVIDGIGGFCVYGSMDKADIARKEGLLPLALAQGSVVKRKVKKGEYLTYDDVDLNPDSTIVQLRKLQDKMIYGG